MAHAIEGARSVTGSGDWQEAVQRWQEVVERPGRGAPDFAYAQLARSYRKLRKYSEAEVAARQGLAAHPNSLRCRLQLAEIVSASGNWHKALECWQEALQHLGPRAPGVVYAGLARAQRELGNLDEAERLVTHGLGKHPDSLHCSRECAELAMKRGDWAGAVQRWKGILQSFGARTPRDALVQLAFAQRQLEIQASAESTRGQAASTLDSGAPSCPPAARTVRPRETSAQALESCRKPQADAGGEAPESSRCARPSSAHRQQGDLQKAETLAKEGLVEHTGDLVRLMELAETAVARAQWKVAVRYCRALLHAGRDAPESVHWWLAHSLRRLGDSAGAAAAARKGLARHPRSPRCLTELAETAVAQKQWQVVVDTCQDLLEMSEGQGSEMTFARAARAHRHLRELAKAETLAKRGLDIHPGSIPCLTELAEIASARPDWRLAVTRWEDLLNLRAHAAPEGFYIRLGQAHRQLREFDRAEAVVARGLKRYPASLSCLTEYAEIATAAGHEAIAVQRWESVLDRRLSRTPDIVQKKIGECAKRIKAAGLTRLSTFVRGVNGSLDLCRPQLCAKVYEAYRAVEALDPDVAVVKFREALQDTEAAFPREIWCASFEKIARFYGGAPGAIPPSSAHASGKHNRPSSVIKLCVGGTGWSGSGALYDYFKEFHQVTATDKVGELPYIEGRNGLGKIPAVFNDSFKAYLFRLYTDSLLGLVNLDHIRGYRDLVEARLANKFAFGAGARELAEAVDDLVVGLIAAQGQTSPNYDGLAAEFLDRVLQALTGLHDGYVLLDNWIHCANVEMFRVLANARLFAVFRDPRSQYVSAKYEGAKGLVADATEYIRSYRRRMDQFRKALNKLPDPSRVTVVQFERFVSDHDYRDSLARDVGLDLDARNRHSRFRPWESERNVTIHENYPDQALMRRIERELPEYCLDLQALKPRDPSLSTVGQALP